MKTRMTHSIDIKKATEKLNHFVGTYSKQSNYTQYSNQTFLNDMLYGIGISIDEKKYFAAQGYTEFLKLLQSHINNELEQEKVIRLDLDVKTADEIPVYKGESSVECLLLNPCDGWHTEYIYFYEDGDYCSFGNFTQDKEYIPNKDFIAWAELPCPLSVIRDLSA